MAIEYTDTAIKSNITLSAIHHQIKCNIHVLSCKADFPLTQKEFYSENFFMEDCDLRLHARHVTTMKLFRSEKNEYMYLLSVLSCSIIKSSHGTRNLINQTSCPWTCSRL